MDTAIRCARVGFSTALARRAGLWLSALLVLALGAGAAWAQPYTLAVEWTSIYSWGTVTSSPPGISCGAKGTGSCSASFPANTPVTLTAVPLPGNAFSSWYGSASGTSPTLTLVMDGNKYIGATWGLATSNMLSVTVSPSGAGTVTSQPAGINCQTACSASFTAGATVSLTATPAPGYTFVGWSGDANQTGSPLSLTLNGGKSVTAIFAAGSATLTVVKAGTGSGRVTGSLGNLDCGGVCTVTVPVNSSIVLTATPDSGSIFERWGAGGACATNLVSCPIQVTRDMTVFVYFSKVLAPASCFAPAGFAHLGTAQADSAAALALGPAGSLYAVGRTAGAYGGPLAGSRNAWVARLTPGGTPLWVRQFGRGADTAALAVSSGPAGSVYLCGYTSPAGVTNSGSGGLGELSGGFHSGNCIAWLARYDANGNRLWYQELGQGTTARAITVDMEGNAYVGGDTLSRLAESPDSQIGESDAWVAKYDALGYRVWLRQPTDWNTEWGDGVMGVSVDPLGNLFVAGERYISTGTADGFLCKLDTAGQEQWTRYFNGAFFTNAVFSGLASVAADGCGNVLFAGGTDGDFAQPNSSHDFDAVVGKLDGSGRLLWRAQLGTDAADAAYAVALDRAGNVYAAGPTYGALATPNPSSDQAIGAGEQFWLARFDRNGTLQCLRQEGTNYVKSPAAGLAVDDAYAVYAVGSASGDLEGPSLGQSDGFLARFAQAPEAGSDLRLTVTSSPHPAIVGSPLTYTLAVTNLGADTFTNVEVIDTLPLRSVYVSVTLSQGDTMAFLGQVDWTVGTLTNGAGAVLQLVARPTAPGVLENQASISTTNLNPCNDQVQTVVTALASNTPPVLRWPLRPSPTGPFQFTLEGLPGRWYEILSSGDLLHWLSLGTLQDTNLVDGFVPYSDATAPGAPYRFYRARLLGATNPPPTNLPNLVPYRPSGWSAPLTVATSPNSLADSSSYSASTPLYLNWAVLNSGTNAITAGFYIAVSVDGIPWDSWNIDPPLDAGFYLYVTGYALGTLPAGQHTLRLEADSQAEIPESNEADNVYTKTISVSP